MGVSPGVEEAGLWGPVEKVVISPQGVASALEKADWAALMTSHGYFFKICFKIKVAYVYGEKPNSPEGV